MMLTVAVVAVVPGVPFTVGALQTTVTGWVAGAVLVVAGLLESPQSVTIE